MAFMLSYKRFRHATASGSGRSFFDDAPGCGPSVTVGEFAQIRTRDNVLEALDAGGTWRILARSRVADVRGHGEVRVWQFFDETGAPLPEDVANVVTLLPA